MQTTRVSPCPNCSGVNLYRTLKPVGASGGHTNDLPGLGTLLVTGRFQMIVCRDCGLTRFFAQRAATDRLADSARWERVS